MSERRKTARGLETAGLITLTTDFGAKDVNVAVMKGVILGINPRVRIVDLSHGVAPQDVAQGGYLLRRAHRYFPQGTIHVAVVDPGVGSDRRAILLETPNALYVAPDNGLLTPVLREAERSQALVRAISLTNPEYWLPQVSNVFHGRDIFAPVAAHLSAGVPTDSFGEEVEDVVKLPDREVEKKPGRILGRVAYVDRFGNLLTNIKESDLISLGESIVVLVAGRAVSRLSRTFSDAPAGTVIAYVDSSSHLAIAEAKGDAAERLGVAEGAPVEARGAGRKSEGASH